LNAADYAAHPDVNQRDHFSFGGGRRICSGIHIAERSLFMNVARILWGFDISPAKDANGNDVLPDFSFEGLVPGSLSNPHPFQCSTSPFSRDLLTVFSHQG
jgi:Cytochrome P450